MSKFFSRAFAILIVLVIVFLVGYVGYLMKVL